ncbi:MAG: putative quinol monooxygenase [Coriobacteriia bacterium]|nr:putative quinol monooxygenase [Coriobacteriia bacterium]
MIKIVGKMKVAADKVDAFKDAAAEIVAKSRAEEGNVSYSLNQSIDDPQTLAFIEVWKDQEAISIHNASEHFTRILPILGGMCEGAPEITLYTEVAF